MTAVLASRASSAPTIDRNRVGQPSSVGAELARDQRQRGLSERLRCLHRRASLAPTIDRNCVGQPSPVGAELARDQR